MGHLTIFTTRDVDMKVRLAGATLDQVLVAALASDADHTRRYRRETMKQREESELNLAQGYSENYPVMFNIFLWFGVAFTMSLIATSIGIATMDPGRDSIIYRMTSNRMKKDN